MRQWGNSRELTQKTYELVRSNPGMNRWTVRAAVHGALVGGFGVLIGLGVVAVGAEMSESDTAAALGIVVMVVGFVLVVAGSVAGLTAANKQLAGLVRVTDDVLHGREPDEDAARQVARSHSRTLAAWSAISVAVNAVVSTISGDGNSGFAVTIVRSLLAGLVATVWAVVTTLVMPVIVLEDAAAVAAIKRSASIVRGTWGEALLGSVRIGARFALVFALPGFLCLVGGVVLAVVVEGPALAAGVVLAIVGIGLILIGAVRAATCRNVFGVALYRWATGDGALGPFSEDDLADAVAVKGSGVPAAA